MLKIRKQILSAFFFLALISPAFIFTSCATIDGIKKDLADIFSEIPSDIQSDNDFPTDDDETDSVDYAILNGIESIKKATEDITPEMAYYIGRKVALSVTQKYKIYDSPEATKYLNSICSALTINSDFPYLYKGYVVAILDTDEINALATPGGHIFITRGLLQCTDSEDAVAAIIAHELSHIQLNHSIKAIRSSRITDAALKTAAAATTVALENSKVSKIYKVSQEDINNFTEVGDKIFGTLIDSGFSIFQEYSADKNALELMKNAGYNPHAMNDMLTLLEKNVKKGESGWSKTHPSPSSRKQNLSQSMKKLSSSKKIPQSRINRFNQYKDSF